MPLAMNNTATTKLQRTTLTRNAAIPQEYSWMKLSYGPHSKALLLTNQVPFVKLEHLVNEILSVTD